MTNYLLSIDPSFTDTGFTLWKNNKITKKDTDNWLPVWTENYTFNLFSYVKFFQAIKKPILQIVNQEQQKNQIEIFIYIERGFFNPKFGRGKEALDHLRGFLASQFNVLLVNNFLVATNSWRKWIALLFSVDFTVKQWTKNKSLNFAQKLISDYNWPINIKNNHNIAESLLIGWYVINCYHSK